MGAKLFSAALAGALEKDQKNGLTAYVLISLLKTANAIKTRKTNHSDFIISHIHEENFLVTFLYLKQSIENDWNNTDSYTLALTLYAFKIYEHDIEFAQQIENELDSRAIIQANGYMHWSDASKADTNAQYSSKTKAADLETTAYILLAKLLTSPKKLNEKINQVIAISKWINSQRNSYGGFYSTQVR